MTTDPGPRMLAVAAYVTAHPGCNKSEAGRGGDAGPVYSGSVERAIRRGLIRQEQDHPASHYRLYAAPVFTCPCCGATSPHPKDIEFRYCGRCHWWTGDPNLGPGHLAEDCPHRTEGKNVA